MGFRRMNRAVALVGIYAFLFALRPVFSEDCNNNGVPDDEDIALGTSEDCNSNGIPDECEAYVEHKLTASDASADDYFGHSVSISGDVVVIGARYDDDVGSSSGSAYNFRFNGSNWAEEAKLTSSDAAAGDNFGRSVSINGDVAVVGASDNDDGGSSSGSAYIFRYNGTSWVEEAKLTASDAAASDFFGSSVSISGDVVLIGVCRDDDSGEGSGSAYIFRFNGSSWAEEAKLTASDAAAGDRFGNSAVISGNVAVIGAYGDDDVGGNSGSTYVFRYNGSSWIEEVKLTASDAATGDLFGYSVSISGDVALVGAYGDDDVDSSSGSAYVYRFNGSSWTEEAKLTASDAAADDYFGQSVYVSGDMAVVGAYKNDDGGSSSGSAYVYRFNGSSWLEQAKLTASDAAIDDYFGWSVAVSDNVVVIGAERNDDGGSNSGSAYVFQIPIPELAQDCNLNGIPDGCDTDCNDNGIPDDCDIADGTSLDCNNNGVPDECDITDGTSLDCNNNGVPDECDIIAGTSLDCNNNGVPDECDIVAGISLDCNNNGIPDECDLVSGPSRDCNGNGIPDECDVAFGMSQDCNGNGVPDECDLDCNNNGVPDECDINAGTSQDCNGDGVPDECDPDCNNNGVPDATDICNGTSQDCNCNGIPDECDIASGTSWDSNNDGVPDECDLDCNGNGIADECEAYVETKLTASDAAETDRFGYSVSISGDVALVGAYHDSDAGGRLGSAYIYRRSGSGWIEEAKLTASDAASLDEFGRSVSISGDVALIGAWKDDDGGNNSGSAYVFRFNGISWVEESKLTASDAGISDCFGYAVSINGDEAVIGSHEDDDGGTNSGSAYVFRFNGTSWIEEAKLTASDAAENDFFGISVSVNSDVALIGAYHNGEGGIGSGAAYVFRFNGTSWVEEDKLTASDAGVNDSFGVSVSISDDVAVIGSHEDDDGGTNSGSAYVYRFNGSSWIEEAKLTASDAAAYDHFGWSVAISGDVVVIGAVGDNFAGSYANYAYLFHFNGSIWTEEAKLSASDAADEVWFGFSVAISGDIVCVGAWNDDDAGSLSGSAYVFSIPSPMSEQDCNTNGIPDDCDIIFGTSQDCNGNGVPDECDIASGTSQDCNENGIPDECEDDNDNDGVPNAQDNCPNTIPGVTVDEFGCPPEVPGDLDRDGDVDSGDLEDFMSCVSGPAVPHDGTPTCQQTDFDTDNDVDLADFGIFQRCYSGENNPADPDCAGT